MLDAGRLAPLAVYLVLAIALLCVILKRWLWSEYPAFTVAVLLGAGRGFGIVFWPQTILYDWWPWSDVPVWGFRAIACLEVFARITGALNRRTKWGIGGACLGAALVVIALAIHVGMRDSPTEVYNRARMGVDLLGSAFLVWLFIYSKAAPFARMDKLSQDHAGLLATQQAWYGVFALIPLIREGQWWALNGMFLVGLWGLQVAWIRLFWQRRQ